jgi:AcrR family transcriptional regulator
MVSSNIISKPSGAYHHGSLGDALLTSALEVLAERGVTRFSLSETARRAGVTPAAPKHHFADTRALLTSLATVAFTDLADRLEADAAGSSQADCVVAQGEAYVAFALERRALFELMWQAALLDYGSGELMAAKRRSFQALDRRVRGMDAPPVAMNSPEMAATLACWSIVHGFAHMAIEGNFGLDWDEARTTATAMLPRSLARLTDPNFSR